MSAGELPFSTAEWFETPSGRGELTPVPVWVAPSESRTASEAAEFPLEFLPRKADNYMNTTFANLPGHQQMERKTAGVLEMHRPTPRRGVSKTGERVGVERARPRDADRARGRAVPRAWWRRGWTGRSWAADGANVNALTSERLTDIGGGATFYSTMVEVAKLGDDGRRLTSASKAVRIQIKWRMPLIAKVDLVGVGLNATDTLIPLAEFPVRGSKLEYTQESVMPGGQVASAMVACQTWGLSTRYVGKLGDDDAARLHERAFAQAGVETQLITCRAAASPRSLILVDGMGERTVLCRKDDRLILRPQELQREWVVQARALLVDGHDTAAATQAAQWAREAGIPVVADLDEPYEGVEALLEKHRLPYRQPRLSLPHDAGARSA